LANVDPIPWRKEGVESLYQLGIAMKQDRDAVYDAWSVDPGRGRSVYRSAAWSKQGKGEWRRFPSTGIAYMRVRESPTVM
jgi:hypothetical protein